MAKEKQRLLFTDDKSADPIDRDRRYQRNLMADRRRVERDIKIDYSRQNKKRRARCRTRPDLFCRTYFKDIFYNPFTPDQKVMVDELKHRFLYGGRKAIAAERGGGKSSITKVVAIWAMLYGWSDWIVIVGANSTDAQSRLKDIKAMLEFNDLLRDDFPEVCDPIRALEGSPQRASSQTAGGERTRLVWSRDEIVLPRVKGSSAAGSIITARGIDSAIRGLVRAEKRPGVIICDDIETRASAASMVDTANRKQTLEKDIVGLAGPGESIAIFLLCTIINRRCLAWEYTDPKKQPAWSGIRQKWIKRMPKATELWDKYVEMRQQDIVDGDPDARRAFRFYKKNRKAMDAGAIVSNKNRFNSEISVDGSALELSSLQSAYNLIADGGWDFFRCEYQNDPPDDDYAETSGLTSRVIQERCNGIARGVIPGWAEYITAGIDVMGRLFYWVVIAWKKGLIGHVVDYGTEPIESPTSGKLTDPKNKSAVESAVLAALLSWRDWELANGWKPETGETLRHVDQVCVDAGWMDTAVYNFVKSAGDKKYRAVKGLGSSSPAAYRSPRKASRDRILGNNYFGSFQYKDKVWLWSLNSDYWKQTTQNAFLTPIGKPGSLTIFGDDPYKHKGYGRQIVAEVWTREFVPGKGYKDYFNVVDKANHYLDATHYATAAAAMLGCQVLTVPGRVKAKISLSEIQKAKREGRL